jgi:hypothetical protein
MSMMSAQQPEGHYALAKLQISVDFSARFGRNMLQDVANCNFSAGDVRKWWKFSMAFLLNDRPVSSVPLPVQTSVGEHVGCRQHTNNYAQMMRSTPCEP